MTWLPLVSLLFFAPALLAVSSRVVLLDGTRLQGEATIDSKSGLVLTNADQGQTNFDFSRIQSVRFHLSDANSSDVSSKPASPKGWTNSDIGAVSIPGSARWANEELTVTASGARFWLAQPDEFHFVYRPFNGNGQMTAEIIKSDAAIAGIMFRQSLAPDSEFAAQAATLGSDGVIFRTRRDRRYRELLHSEGDSINRDDLRPPCWLKLVRRDKRFAAYQSMDEGISWQAIYESPNDWPRTIFAGVFVVSGTSNALRSASFSNLLVEDEMDNRKLDTNRAHQVELTLNDGSILRSDQISADATKVRFKVGGSNFTASVLSVSRVLYAAVPERLNAEQNSRRRGVLLKTGDFFEGDISSIDKTEIKLSSVLFGSRSFPAERVLAVNISAPLSTSAPLQVRTLEGSLIQANTVVAGENSVTLEEPRLGRWSIGLADLAEITRKAVK